MSAFEGNRFSVFVQGAMSSEQFFAINATSGENLDPAFLRQTLRTLSKQPISRLMLLRIMGARPEQESGLGNPPDAHPKKWRCEVVGPFRELNPLVTKYEVDS